jgi:hypothetical protein
MESDSTLIDCSSSKDSQDTNSGNYLDAKDVKFTTKETYYYRSIDKYYKKLPSQVIKQMIAIVNSESKISLRQLDWFVTKHADKNIIIINQNNDNSDRISVHISYKAQLKSFKKKYFDPFRRLKKFYYTFNVNGKKEKILTTIGQLNFFRWAFKNNIIKYVEDNYDSLTNEMIVSNKKEKETKSKSSEKKKSKVVVKKKGITVTAKKVKSLMNEDNKIIVSFD